MRTLAIETATAACSVALFDNERLLASSHEVVGRGHAERLIPMINELPEGGRAEQILVGCGPGSFTGIRVGISAAKGLALGWDVPVFGFATPHLLASQFFASNDSATNVTIVNEGGHGEIFVASYERIFLGNPVNVRSLKPQALVAELKPGQWLAGSAVSRFTSASAYAEAVELLPDTRFAMALPASARALPPSPSYARAADAKLPAK